MRFSAKVRKIGINPYVRVPAKVVEALLSEAKKASGPVPVRGRVQGAAFRATVLKFSGIWRLYLNTYMRKDAGVDVGDPVEVELEFDPEPRTVPMNRELARALSADYEARAAFARMAPSHKKEMLRYLNSLKSEEAVQRGVGRILALMKGRKASGLGYLVRRPKRKSRQ